VARHDEGQVVSRLPLGLRAGDYLRAKRRRLTESSYRDYEACLDKLARYFADLDLADLEPPVGTERLEEFRDHQWGTRSGRTFNKALSILHDFFRHHQLRGNIQGDPTLAIERAKKRDVHRETIPPEDRAGLLAANEDRRDRVALRLLLDYGIRKGSLRGIHYRHFDHQRRRLTLVVAKGGKVRELPIPDTDFWARSGAPDHRRRGAAAPLPALRAAHNPVRPPRRARATAGAAQPFPRAPDGRARRPRLVVRLPGAGRARRAGPDVRGEDAPKPLHRRAANP
jgi:integrase